MERIAQKTSALTPAGTTTIDFVIQTGFVRWSLLIVPINASASPNTVTLAVQYGVNGSFYPVAPALGGTLSLNSANTFTSQDAVGQVRLVITCGATVPDGGVAVALYGSRASA